MILRSFQCDLCHEIIEHKDDAAVAFYGLKLDRRALHCHSGETELMQQVQAQEICKSCLESVQEFLTHLEADEI